MSDNEELQAIEVPITWKADGSNGVDAYHTQKKEYTHITEHGWILQI